MDNILNSRVGSSQNPSGLDPSQQQTTKSRSMIYVKGLSESLRKQIIKFDEQLAFYNHLLQYTFFKSLK